jgi:hypothetical protein
VVSAVALVMETEANAQVAGDLGDSEEAPVPEVDADSDGQPAE